MVSPFPIRVFRTSPLAVWSMAAVGTLLLALVVYVRSKFPLRLDGAATDAVFVGIACASFLVAYAAAKSRTTLYDDRAEWSGAFFPAKRLAAHEVAGYRRTSTDRLRLIPRNKGRAITIPAEALDAGAAWLERLPDLDVRERESLRKSALMNRRFGETALERAEFIDRLPKRLRWLSALGWFGGLWAMLWPQPYEAALIFLGLSPITTFALLLWLRPLVNVDELRDEPGEISIFGMFFLPSIAFALRGLLDFNLLDDVGLLLTALMTAVPLAMLVTWCDPPLRRRAGSLAGVTLLCAFLIAGVLTHLNTLLDTAAAQRYESSVVKKPESGRYKHKIVVGPWGNEAYDDELRISDAVHGVVKVGDRVCIHVKPGALGWRWYWVDLCN